MHSHKQEVIRHEPGNSDATEGYPVLCRQSKHNTAHTVLRTGENIGKAVNAGVGNPDAIRAARARPEIGNRIPASPVTVSLFEARSLPVEVVAAYGGTSETTG